MWVSSYCNSGVVSWGVGMGTVTTAPGTSDMHGEELVTCDFKWEYIEAFQWW